MNIVRSTLSRRRFLRQLIGQAGIGSSLAQVGGTADDGLWSKSVRARGGREKLHSLRRFVIDHQRVERKRSATTWDVRREVFVFDLPDFKVWHWYEPERSKYFSPSLWKINFTTGERVVVGGGKKSMRYGPTPLDLLAGIKTPYEEQQLLFLGETARVRPYLVERALLAPERAILRLSEDGYYNYDFEFDPATGLPRQVAKTLFRRLKIPGFSPVPIEQIDTYEYLDYATVERDLTLPVAYRITRTVDGELWGTGTYTIRWCIEPCLDPSALDQSVDLKAGPDSWRCRAEG